MNTINLQSIQRDREILERITNDNGDIDPQLVAARGGIINIINSLSGPALEILIEHWGNLIQNLPNNLEWVRDQADKNIPGRVDNNGVRRRTFEQRVELSRFMVFQIYEQIMINPEQTYVDRFLPGSIQLTTVWPELFQNMIAFIPIERAQELRDMDPYYNDDQKKQEEERDAQQQDELDRINQVQQPQTRMVTRQRGLMINVLNNARLRKALQDEQQKRRPGKRIPLDEYESVFRDIFTQKQQKPRDTRLRRNRQLEQMIIYTFPNRYIHTKSMFVTDDYYQRIIDQQQNLFQGREDRLARTQFFELNGQYMDRILNLLRSQNDPDYLNPNDPLIDQNTPLKLGFQFAIQQALGRLQQQPPNLAQVRDNVVQPFIDDLIEVVLPYIRQRWNETNGQPASNFISAYFFKQQGIPSRRTVIPNIQNPGFDFQQQWNNKIITGTQNFMVDLLYTYAVYSGLPDPEILLNGDRFNVDFPVPNIASGLEIPENIDIDVYQRLQLADDLIADILGLTTAGRARFNLLHQSQAGNDINLLSLLRDIFDFIYQYLFVYWDNLRYQEYSNRVNIDGSHIANILCQLHFGANFNKPNPYNESPQEIQNWLQGLNITDTNLHDVIFQIWTYTFLIVLMHSVELTPVELRFAKIFLYPNQIEFTFRYNEGNWQEGNIIQQDYLPLQDMPFVLPRMIMRQLTYNIQDRTALQLEGIQVPAMLYKRYYRNRVIYNQVAQPIYYTLRLDNLQTYFTFQLKTTSILAENPALQQPENVPEIYPRLQSRLNDDNPNPDYELPEINPQLYHDWPGLTQSMNAAANIIIHFLRDLRQLLNNDNINPLTPITRRRLKRRFRIAQNDFSDHPVPPLNSYGQLHMIFVASAANQRGQDEIGRVNPSIAQINRAHHPINSATSRFRLKEMDVKITLSHRFIQRLDIILNEYVAQNGFQPDQIQLQNIITDIITGLFIQSIYDMVSNNLGFQRNIDDDQEGSFFFNTLQLAEFDAIYDYRLASCTFVMIPRSNEAQTNNINNETLTQFNWNVQQEATIAAFLDPELNPTQFQGPTRWINGAVFSIDNLPYEIKSLLPKAEDSVIQRIYMERINLKYSCLTSYAAVFFFIFGIPEQLIDDIGNDEVILHKISIRGYYFFRQLIIKYYRQGPDYKGPQLVLVLGNNDFLGYLLSIHFRNKDLCYLQPTHFECFKIQSFNDDDHTAQYIRDISLLLDQHPSHKQTDLVQLNHPLRDRIIIPVYYHYDHVFILEDGSYSEYVKICQRISIDTEFKKKPIINDTIDAPSNRTRFLNKPRGQQYMIVYDIETTSGLEEQMEPYLIYSIAFDLESELNKLRMMYQWLEQSSVSDPEFDDIKQWWDQRSTIIQHGDVVEQFIQNIMDSCEQLPDNSVVQVWAYNGSRFDHVLLVPTLIRMWGDVKILGNPTNVKGLLIDIQRGIQIQFCDICMAVGGGKLDDNARYFDIPGKLYDEPPIDILQIKDWQELPQQQRDLIIQYCRRDVFSATLLLVKFNDYCEDIAREMHSGHPQDNLDPVRYQNALYISNTLSQTAFKIVHKHIRTQPIYVLDDLRVYKAMRESYKGGICQIFTTHREVCSMAEQIHYLDVNSLYPYVMSKNLFGVKYTTIKYMRQYMTPQTTNPYTLYAICKFQLAPMFKYGFFPVKSPLTERTFYPMSWDIFEASRLYDQEPEYLWVWGFEILNLFELNKATFLEKSIIKVDMYIPCDEVNKDESMFKDIEKLYIKRIQTENPCIDKTIKRIMNMAYGKYGQRDHSINHFISRERFMNITQNNQNYINELCSQINSKYYPTRQLKVKAVNMVRGNSALVQLQLQDKYDDIEHIPKLSKMVHIASQITARAREHMWNIVYRVHTTFSTNRLLYMDTDSFIWKCDTLNAYPMMLMHNMGTGLGQVKKVEHALMWFQGLAPKMYAYQQFQTEDGPQSEVKFKIKGFDQRQHEMEYVQQLFELIGVSGTGTYTQVQWVRLPGQITRREIKKQITIFNKRKMCNCYTHDYSHEEAYHNEKEIYEAEVDYIQTVRNMARKDMKKQLVLELTKQDIQQQEQLINEHIQQYKLNDTVPGFVTASSLLDINTITESRISRYTNPQILDEYKLIQKIMKKKLKSQFLQHRDCYAYNLLASRKPYIYKLIRLFLVVYETCKSIELEAVENWTLLIERIKYIETEAELSALSGSHQYSLRQAFDFTVERLKQMDVITNQESFKKLEQFSKNELKNTSPNFHISFYNRW